MGRNGTEHGSYYIIMGLKCIGLSRNVYVFIYIYVGITPIMENQMQKKTEHEITTGIIQGLVEIVMGVPWLALTRQVYTQELLCSSVMGFV